MNPLIHTLAAAVHDAYVADKRAQDVVSLPSRRGTGDLMRPYNELDPVDQADDLRTVHTILAALSRLPWVQVCDLLLSFRDDAGVLAELRRAANVVDPEPVDLAGRCLDAIAAEDGRR